MEYDTSLAERALELASKWDTARGSTSNTFTQKDLEGFNSNQIG